MQFQEALKRAFLGDEIWREPIGPAGAMHIRPYEDSDDPDATADLCFNATGMTVALTGQDITSDDWVAEETDATVG